MFRAICRAIWPVIKPLAVIAGVIFLIGLTIGFLLG